MRKVVMPDYLSELVRPLIERDYKEEIENAAKKTGRKAEGK